MKRRLVSLIALLLPAAAYAQDTSIIALPQLNPPIVLRDLRVWRDGGSLGFVLGDGLGKTITFTVDGKLGSPTPRSMFLGVTHRDDPGAQQLPLDGAQERQLLTYLALWLDAKFDRADLERVFNTVDSRQWTQEQLSAYHVKRLIETRSDQLREQ